MKKPKDCSIRYAHRVTARGEELRETPVRGNERNGETFDQIIQGDAVHILSHYPDQCIDLIVTSPPYADSRKKTYGGLHPDHHRTNLYRSRLN